MHQHKSTLGIPARSVAAVVFLAATMAIASVAEPPPTPLATKEWSIGYYTPFGQSFQPNGYPILADLDWGALTHLNLVGGTPQANGSVVLTSNFATVAPQVIAAAHARGVKVLYVLGAEGGGTYDFTTAINRNLATLVANIMATVTAYGFDGVDVDYEGGWNAASGAKLFPALRAALGTKLLTAAAWVHVSADYLPLHPLLDRINVMTYGMSGGGDSQSWFNAALYGPQPPGWQTISIDLTMTRWIASGIPAAKLGIGIPFYGTLSTGNGVAGPRQPPGATFNEVGYLELAQQYALARATFDAGARVPWLAVSNGWINWDNAASITEKVAYVKSKGLGGWIIWHVGWDYQPASMPKHPLLEAVRLARAAQSLPSPSPPPPSPPPPPPPSGDTLAKLLNFAETWDRNWNFGGHMVDSRFTADYGKWDYTESTYEPWLFDRATVGYRLFELTGDSRWRDKFLSDFAFYRAHIDAQGIFTPKGFNNSIYGYVTPFVLYERLSGDQQYRPIAKRIYDSWVRKWSPSFQPTGGTRLRTEREMAFALEAAIGWYELTQDAAARSRAAAIVQQWKTASGSAGAPLISYTQHEGEGPGGATPQNLTNSPWMSALYFQALRRYYALTNDAEALSQASKYADWCNANCYYDAALAHVKYSGLTFPRYLTGELIGHAGYKRSNMAHCLDIRGFLKFALFAKQQLGESLSTAQTRYAQMGACADRDFVEWTRTAIYLPKYRLKLPRKFNWILRGYYEDAQ